MSLLIAVVVAYGFSPSVNQKLILVTSTHLWNVYPHGVVFSGWVVFFIVQSALLRTHNVAVRRRLRWFGVAWGLVIVWLGLSTSMQLLR